LGSSKIPRLIWCLIIRSHNISLCYRWGKIWFFSFFKVLLKCRDLSLDFVSFGLKSWRRLSRFFPTQRSTKSRVYFWLKKWPKKMSGKWTILQNFFAVQWSRIIVSDNFLTHRRHILKMFFSWISKENLFNFLAVTSTLLKCVKSVPFHSCKS
jgi:hypothetical protein